MNILKSLSLVLITFIYTNTFCNSNVQNEHVPLKNYKGLLWEISGEGLKKPSYLYGTMHVSKKVAFHLTDTFFVALKSADIVGLETNPENWMADLFGSDLFKDMLMTFDQNNTNTIQDLYGKAFYLAPTTESDFKKALRDKNSIANHMLFRFSSYGGTEDFEENTYLDMFIFQTAKKYGKKVTSLEQLQKAIELMLKSRMEKDEDDEDEELTYYDWKEAGKTMNELMEEAYREGDLNTLDSLTRFGSYQSRMFHKYMIVERNKIMANSIDSLINEGLVTFSGIGAAHLPGDEGVIELLRQKGYHLRPVSTNTTSKAFKEKKKIEKTYVKEVFNEQNTLDGVISLHSPGKLHLIPFEKNVEMYLYPEMANGVYYSLYRLKNHAFVDGKASQRLLKKIDSILYENTPGSLLKREYLTTDGYPSIHVKNKSRRGDYQEYRLIFTPLETVLLKVGGTGEYLKKNKVDEYFDSFKYTPKLGTTIFSPTSGGFKVKMPGKYLVDSKWDGKKSNNQRDIQITSYDKESNSYYYVLKSAYHDFNYLEEDTFELNMFAYKFSKKYDYHLVEKKKTKTVGHPSLTCTFHKPQVGYVYADFIKAGAFYYMIMQYSATAEKNTTFFESFDLVPFVYTEEIKTINDSINFFTVKTAATYPDYSELLKKYPFMKKMYMEEVNKKNAYTEYDNHISFVYPKTGELIDLDIYRESKYTQRLTDDRTTPIHEIEGYETYIVLKDSIHFTEDSTLYTSFIALTDTNSTRAIWQTYIEKGAFSYSISANVDLITGPSDLVKQFMTSFSPQKDTIIGESVYTDKRKLFYKDIYSEDSTTKAEAASAIDYVSFKKEDFSNLLTLTNIVKLGNNKLDYAFRVTLFNKIASLASQESINYLSKLYTNYPDSTTLHLKVLTSLSETKTKQAYSEFKKLLLDNTPLTEDKWEIHNIFYALDDSLELASTLFPELLSLNKFPEYELYVYDVLNKLIDSSMVDPKIYESYLNELIRKANNELKRELSAEEKNKGNKSSNSWDTETFSIDSWSYDIEYASGDDSEVNTELLTYTKLLIPFYETNKRVQEFFEKLNKLENEYSQITFQSLKLEHRLPVVDTLWNTLAQKKGLLPEVYSSLKSINRLDVLDTSYQTQQSMVNAFLSSKIDMKKDSSVFLRKILIENPGLESGYVYFYKYKKENSNKWVLYYTGYQPKDKAKVNEVNYISDTNTLSKKDNIDELIEEIVFELNTSGRMRVVNENDYLYNYY